ncbi:MAG TPA: glycosyltransferase, partial [Solirubrobacteraceae bacterium]|nr:glycosyltransferase [Solirubrobacteraceae bacterium]
MGSEKLHVRGVTYGTFRPGEDESPWPPRPKVADDLDMMAAAGINALRTYVPPPAWLLDAAHDRGLRVLVGLPWEQHVAFLERRAIGRSIAARVSDNVRLCAGHPAVLGYAVGNEIPASIVRWHGRVAVESFIERLYDRLKRIEADALVTYVNYPTTEYLQLPFLDFACFNVYLETPAAFSAYIRRLQHLVGDQPLVLAELGLDSRRHGEEAQAEALRWQIDTAVAQGCAGTFVFAWTDEWHRSGSDIEDWDFGLVTRSRHPKPALDAVTQVYTVPADRRGQGWPRMSVVVCTYNGERWLPGCLDALSRIDYPNWEAIVVSDGSVDGTVELARERRGVRLIESTENRGLAAARNLGFGAATGEIVAYLDDDARPDADWLRQLALAFERSSHAAIGGPNLAPPDDGTVAQCVAAAPGGPVHVLVDDDLAEHIPGCNMAIRRDCLEAIGGFDPRYWIAGDDVDLCWRLQREGYTIGFSPAAVVWHHRRGSVRSYLKQQYEYGKAEGQLHKKWPERYNRLGHLTWHGRVYGRGSGGPTVGRRARIHYGSWGSRLFQSIYESDLPGGAFRWLPALPESYLLLGALTVLGLLGLEWPPLLVVVPFLAVGLAAVLVSAVARTGAATRTWRCRSRAARWTMIALTILLHTLQPMARLAGRLRGGVSPWGRRCSSAYSLPRRRHAQIWSEHWRPAEDWLASIESRLQSTCHAVARGGDSDRWDLQVRGGALGVVRVLFALEEHGQGQQLARFRWWPRYSRVLVGAVSAMVVL